MAYLASVKLTVAKVAYLPSRYPRLFIFRATRMAMSSTVHHSSEDAGAANSIKTLADLPGPLNLPIIKTGWTVLLLGFSGEPLGKRMLPLQAESIKKYGKIYLIEIPDVKAVQLSDPADVETVLRNEPKYPERFRSPIFDYYREKRKKKPGVFFANGTVWHNYRSVISRRMLRPTEVANHYSSPFNEIVSAFCDRVKNIRECPGSEREYEVKGLDNELFKWSFESVAEMLFDKRFGCLDAQVNEDAQAFITAIAEFLEATLASMFYPIWLVKIFEPKPVKKMFDNFDRMYDYAEMFIEQRLKELEEREQMKPNERKSEGKIGFFEFLLSSGNLTKEDLLASVIDILFGGVETTSNTMQWVLYMLARNPEKQAILRQEVLSVLGEQSHASPDTIAQMPYLRAWVRETLRLYPPLTILSRITSKDLSLSGYYIPAGTELHMHIYHMSRDENVFLQPTAFRPERWLRDKTEDNLKSNMFNEAKEVFSSLPFGFGTRMCIGRRIAELELHLLLARIVQQFEIHYPPGAELVEPFMRGIIIPDRPVRVKFMDRNK